MKLIGIGLLFLLATTGGASAQGKPNIVLILADNLGYGELGSHHLYRRC